MDRRDVLRAAGLTGLLGLSGCTGAVPIVGETTLGMFAVYNYHQESDHRFDVRIERDGAVVHESSHRLRAFDPTAESASPPNAVVSCTWNDTAGEYTVFVRSDSREWRQFDVIDGVAQTVRPPECVIAYARYGDDVGPSEDPPKFTFVLDETDCTEAQNDPEGCAWVD